MADAISVTLKCSTALLTLCKLQKQLVNLGAPMDAVMKMTRPIEDFVGALLKKIGGTDDK